MVEGKLVLKATFKKDGEDILLRVETLNGIEVLNRRLLKKWDGLLYEFLNSILEQLEKSNDNGIIDVDSDCIIF